MGVVALWAAVLKIEPLRFPPFKKRILLVLDVLCVTTSFVPDVSELESLEPMKLKLSLGETLVPKR